MADTATMRPATRVLGLVLGYGAACVVASLAMTIMFLGQQIGQPDHIGVTLSETLRQFMGMTGISLLFIFFLSLPGFVLLRTALWALGRREVVGFIVIGALNGLLAALFVVAFSGEPSMSLPAFGMGTVIPGALGGAAAWWVERWFSNKKSIKAPAI